MELLETDDIAEFQKILRRNRWTLADFSLSATDTTDPKTDEVPALQGELTVRRKSTGQTKQYLISDSTSWLDLFRNDIKGGAFVGQDALQVRHRSSGTPKPSH
ncbi:transcriptional regulator [Massilia endophytica]|uniref:transcriptional regulator n=1 Tax=Massilia endophytica TaxID=2899220 RepID=UPI001E45FAE5|nr:transcriptional regulator [Massilia endophytica]UGQ48825.1 transcriptional regulator [Massilia endophytica]